jgi:predicted DsbA family dithiol-disulfide isomerase
MQVEIWSDLVCPWCYLGKRRFERALESFDHRDEVTVVYRSFELDPSAPAGPSMPTVELLASKYGMTAEQAEDAQRQMERRAAEDELAERLHRAYFTEQASIFDHSSLTEFAVEAGLDRDDVIRVLASEEYGDAVDTDEAMAQALGANGVPLFVVDRRYGISGAQPPEVIAEVLDRAWAEAGAPRPGADADTQTA